MRIRGVILALIMLLAILILVATTATVLMGGSNILVKDDMSSRENVSMAVVGDVMFARNMPGVLSFDSSPFAGVSNVTSNVDLLLINFENAATTAEVAVKSDVPFKCDPSYVPLARANNNTVAALANNHATDYGIVGMNDTIHHLKEAGITPMGAGNTEDEAHQAVTKEIKGRNITILNYMDSNNFAEYPYEMLPYANGSSPGYSAYDSEDAQKQISEHNDSDMVVAYLHFGNEYSHSPNEDQQRIAHELIDYGADVVVGNHPHVAQGIEMYKGKPIFYSLGDFIFDLQRPETLYDYFVQIDLIGDTGQCTVYPVYLSNYLPQYMDQDSANEFLNGLDPKSDELEITNGTGKLTFNLTG
ncbi:CapA family protein [Methanobrevibacter sp.]|uniref:CapA family protein n=1 Tax=Methanobrevibacter sp. TaxID=66852 RepID=UPI00388FD0C0